MDQALLARTPPTSSRLGGLHGLAFGGLRFPERCGGHLLPFRTWEKTPNPSFRYLCGKHRPSPPPPPPPVPSRTTANAFRPGPSMGCAPFDESDWLRDAGTYKYLEIGGWGLVGFIYEPCVCLESLDARDG